MAAPQREKSDDTPHRMSRKKRVVRSKEEFGFAIGTCSFGFLLAALSEFGLVALIVGDDPKQLLETLQRRFRKASFQEGAKDAKNVLRRAVRFIEKPHSGFDVPLNIRGTAFQQRVWHAVRAIPLGETSTYSDIARKINAPRAVRAVGSACTGNPMFLAIPCHRVLHKGETLAGGFSKSSTRQQALVRREQIFAGCVKP